MDYNLPQSNFNLIPFKGCLFIYMNQSEQTVSVSAYSPSKRQRVAWIDFARYFAIIFVCEAHSGMHLLNRNGLWAGAGVFLFFFLAGYFNRKQGFPLLKRCGILFICSTFWSFIKTCIVCHGLHFSLQEFGFFNNTMWFFKHMILWMLLSPIFCAIPYQWIKNVIPAILLALFCISCQGASNTSLLHVSYYSSAGLFYLGMNIQGNNLDSIFPTLKSVSNRTKFGTTCVLLFCILIVSLIVGNNHGVFFAVSLLFIIAYLMLAVSYYAEKSMPTFVRKVAKLGAATIFIYVCHSAVFHVWTGGFIAIFHFFPPVFFTLILALAILLLGPWFFYKFEGKNRLVDILLFAK